MQSKNKIKPLVSVIVPFYNEEKHIEECLVSIKKQNYPSIELIVVDDGSRDASTTIARKYADIFLTQSHQGPGVARNKAAKQAKGQILVFVDADMYLDKRFIEKIIQPITSNNAYATFTNNEYLANKANIWVKCGNIDNNIPTGKRVKDISNNSSVTRAIRKDTFLKLGGMKPELGYRDDHLLNGKYKSIAAKEVICYHYNPDTLKEIYESARWIGGNPYLSNNKINLLKYSIFNSILIAIKKMRKGAPWRFVIYKVVFDFGIFCGILFPNAKNNYAK